MTLQALEGRRFVRRTQLAPGEYRRNFRQIDREILSAVTSAEADRVTPLMSKVYLRLVNAPERFWEREGVLRFEAEMRDEKLVKAWTVLCDLVGVASATASKALRWMHEQGIIGYFSGKNGVGLRIFLNRAVSSIGVRQAPSEGKKILAFPPASPPEAVASANEPAFYDSFAVLEVLDTDVSSAAPKNGADKERVGKKDPQPSPPTAPQVRRPSGGEGSEAVSAARHAGGVLVSEIVERLKSELEPQMTATAAKAAAQTAAREMTRTREWFETKALPKAVRVAQHETYNLLRRYGRVEEQSQRARAGLGAGRQADDVQPSARPLTPEEVREAAEVCVALLETQGKPVEVMLSEISSEAGGWLLPEDAPRVREEARALLDAREAGRS